VSSCPTSPASTSLSRRRRWFSRTTSARWAGDNAGWPFGGRRPNDDVVDIGLRALAGALVPGFSNAPPLGDGVNSNDVPTLDHFPFHAPPHAGFRHSQQEGTDGKGTPTGQ
jgi:hypothetical protein